MSETKSSENLNDTGKEPNETSLSIEQIEALANVQAGRNVFITGSAGVGKSFVLKKVIDMLPRNSTYVTASTGVAACNIGGITVHSFAGIGFGQDSVSVLLDKLSVRAEPRRRWLTCKTLVIDEISMIDGELFEKIEEIARMIRGIDLPFGGIQLVVCGDFLQLPPVQKPNENKKFCFEVAAWKRCIQKTVLLKTVFRQKEEEFIKMLNRIRLGEMIRLDAARLQKSSFTRFNQDDGIKPTRLFPHRTSCDRINEEQLQALPGNALLYESMDLGKEEYIQQLNKFSRFPQVISLKVGAQVMLLKNLDVQSGLVNGARGVVTALLSQKEQQLKYLKENSTIDAAELEEIIDKNIDDINRYPLVKFVNGEELLLRREKSSIEVAGKEVASRSQIPLALAWAVSIHKAQGMTLERVELSLGKVFEYGQAYVALSRCTSVAGLRVSDFNSSKVKAHPKVLDYYKILNEKCCNEKEAHEPSNYENTIQLPGSEFAHGAQSNQNCNEDKTLNVDHSKGHVKESPKDFFAFFSNTAAAKKRQRLFFNQGENHSSTDSKQPFHPQKRPRCSEDIVKPGVKQQKHNSGKSIVLTPISTSNLVVKEDNISGTKGNAIIID